MVESAAYRPSPAAEIAAGPASRWDCIKGATVPDRKLFSALSAAAQRELSASFGRLQAEIAENLRQTALRVRVVRPDDLLVLDFAFDNLERREQGDRRFLVRRDGSKPARMIVHHQPQAIGEGVYQEEPFEPGPHPPFTAPSRLAGKSRVAVTMPVEVASLDWSLEAFLKACSEWPLALDYAARPDPRQLQLPFPPGGILIDQLGQFIRQAQARAGIAEADALSLRRSAARLGAGMIATAREGRPRDDAQIARLLDSELQRTLAGGPRRPAAQTKAAREILTLATAEQMVREALTPGRLEQAPSLELIDPLLPFLGVPHEPSAAVTAIELPWRVIHTPLATAGFTHAETPVTHEGQTELWHSRLGRRSGGEVDDSKSQPLRAIWSPDYGSPQETSFTTSSTAEDRHFLVHATAGYSGVPEGWPTPVPGDARRLILSALGARLDYYGEWKVNGKLPLESWTHQAALGRDFYVRIVKAGFLFPFGHKAVYIVITERKFETVPEGGGRMATLRQKHFIVVREPVRSFPSLGMPDDGRGLPFQAVEILTRETPPLAKPPAGQPNWWPTRSGKDFLFDCVGVDHAGQRIPFSAPLAFIRIDANGAEHPSFATIATAYNNGNDGRAKRPLNGARVAFAPLAIGDPDAGGDTRIPTETISFQGIPAAVSRADAPHYYPNMKGAEVVSGAVQALTGERRTAVVSFPPIYRTSGLAGSNVGQVFLEAQSQALKFGGGGVGADKVGGLVTPDMTPTAFSRRFGVVAGPMGTFAGGHFDPASVFPDAKLLGVLPLRDILHAVTNVAGDPGQTPKFDQVEFPDRVVAELRLKQTNLRAVLVFEPDIGGQSELDIRARTTVMRNGGAVETSVQGSLTHFRINLFGMIALNFDRLRFFAEPGRKPEVDVDLDPDNGVVFGGPLRFVNTLRDVIPSNGFSDPPDLSISPSGITASYSLALPTIGVGIFSLQNVSLGAGFTLPFTGDSPSVRFNFAERHNPFNLTVSLLGGGGFFLIGIDAGGVREIEAALEFGAQIAIDLGVASGRVYVKAGVYFHWRETPDKLVELDGYVEMGGELSVLGLISVSLTFHLSLGYRKTGGQAEVRGQAELVVEVEVLFFSASVTVRVERRFAGAPSDPTFVEFVPTDDAWRNYCAAFA